MPLRVLIPRAFRTGLLRSAPCLILCLALLSAAPAPARAADATREEVARTMQRLIPTYAQSYTLLHLAGTHITLQQGYLRAELAEKLTNAQARRTHEGATKGAKDTLDALDQRLASVDPERDFAILPPGQADYFRSMDKLMHSASAEYRAEAEQVSARFAAALDGTPPDQRQVQLDSVAWSIQTLQIENRYMQIRRTVLNKANPQFFLANAQIANSTAMIELNSMFLESARQPENKGVARRHLRSSAAAAQEAKRHIQAGHELIAKLDASLDPKTPDDAQHRMSGVFKQAFEAEDGMADTYLEYFSTGQRIKDRAKLAEALKTGLQKVYAQFAKLQQARTQLFKEQSEILSSVQQ